MKKMPTNSFSVTDRNIERTSIQHFETRVTWSLIFGCSVPSLTQDEVQFALRLKGIVKRDQEGRLADVLEHLPLSASMFCCLCLLNNSCFL